jgi:hypothetical protein
MLPMQPLRLALGTTLAADPTTLAPAGAGNKIALIKAPFTPAETLQAADLTLADFVTSTPLLAAIGPQQVGIDPATGQQRITIIEPLGGWRWQTTALTNLPQTIYGFALFDNTLATLLAVALLPAPTLLNIIGDEINLDKLTLVFVQRPIS